VPALAYPHIEVRPDGIPYLIGTQTKVVEIVLWRLAYHWDADEMQRQHPDLSLAQIYSALAYYHDHKDEVDADIDRRLRREQELLDPLADSPLRLKLQAAKRAAYLPL
jgi:uncharacterized protein (DUF433 family)